MRSRIPVGFSDLLAGVFLSVLIGTMTIVEVSGAREVANRAKCASNLHQIGLAILLYQNENNQLMPRTVMDTTDDPKPVWGTPYEKSKDIGPISGGDLGSSKDADPFAGGKAAPDANDVSASFYLLMRCEQLAPSVFVCPSSKAKAWDFGGGANSALAWTNWNGMDGVSKHLSYSYQNPFISKAAIEAGYQLQNPDATFAVAADINPGGTAVTSLKIDASADEMKKGNSPNHAQDGQNVLYGDGHAEWQNNPFCGSHHDNIYTAAGPEIESAARKTAVVVSSPVDRDDSILLPSVADGVTPLTPEQISKLSKAIQGQYTTVMHGYHAVLSIDDKTIQWVTGPLTVKYDYKLTGADGQGLQMALTAPDTTATAVATLNDKDLHIEMSGEFTLNFPWKRIEKK